MKHCADTWFLLLLAERDEKACKILREVTQGKDRLVIPGVVIAELTKKLLMRGKKLKEVKEFVKDLEKERKMSLVQTSKEITIDSGSISLTFSMPLIDALIASTAKNLDCDSILSDDRHYEKFCKKHRIKLMRW